jgi:hypothetical protein
VRNPRRGQAPPHFIATTSIVISLGGPELEDAPITWSQISRTDLVLYVLWLPLGLKIIFSLRALALYRHARRISNYLLMNETRMFRNGSSVAWSLASNPGAPRVTRCGGCEEVPPVLRPTDLTAQAEEHAGSIRPAGVSCATGSNCDRSGALEWWGVRHIAARALRRIAHSRV